MVTRRQFIASAITATGALAIGFAVPTAIDIKRRLTPAKLFGEHGWLEIDVQGNITVKCTLSEMGQGVWTTLAQCVAEELNVALEAINIKMAPALRTFNAPIGFFTGGSSSASRLFNNMRAVAVAARQQLVSAGAASLNVSASECDAVDGFVVHSSSDRKVAFGELTRAAAALPAPSSVHPKKPKNEWRILGRSAGIHATRRIVTGEEQYGIDLRVPGMLVAAVSQQPSPDSKLQSVDRAAALAAPGVVRVVELADTIAVVAKTYWQATQALAAAKVEWQSSTFDTEQARQQLLDNLEHSQPENQTDSDDTVTVEATYETPLLLHMQMEPLNATAKVDRFSAELWVPTQAQQMMQTDVAQALGMWPHLITVHSPRLGGGFGRRLSTDYGVTAALIAREFDVPVKTIWSREEDSRQGRFRTMSAAKLRARISRAGTVHAWHANAVSLGSLDRSHGLSQTLYQSISPTVTHKGVDADVRTGSWRSVDASQNVFYRESFIDECAHAVNLDAIAFRRQLLKDDARALRVLDTLVASSNWTTPRNKNTALGIAFNHDFGSLAAAAAELSIDQSGEWRVAKLFVVVDCGVALNPNLIKAQLEGGALFAMSAALFESATYAGGALKNANYGAYRVLRFNETPEVAIEILETDDADIGGIGEVAVPLIAPAIANALFAGTDIRRRRLPLLTPPD